MFKLSQITKPSLATLLLGATLLAAAPSASAQLCPDATNNFWKVDSLPDNPIGSMTISVIPGLCEGEGIANVFPLAGQGPQRLTSVVCPFGANGGTNGFVASVNIQIYDGVTFSGPTNTPTLGPKVFDLGASTGSSMQVTSTALNVFDMSQFNVIVGNSGADNFVVAFTMQINPNGNCASGFNANFFTDNTQFSFNCDPQTTPAKTSLMLIQGQGWQDVSTATVTGVPICPFFYSGVWAIRACTENAGPVNPIRITAFPNPIPVGSFSTLTFHAPGFEGIPYLAAASFSTSPGIPTAFGTIPLNFDVLTEISLNNPSVFVNFAGTIGAGTGTSPGLLIIPNDPGFIGLSFFLAFVAVPPDPAPWGISSALKIVLQ